MSVIPGLEDSRHLMAGGSGWRGERDGGISADRMTSKCRMTVRTAGRHRRGPDGERLSATPGRGVGRDLTPELDGRSHERSLRGVVARQPGGATVLDRGGEQVEGFDELCDGSIAELVGQREPQRAPRAIGEERKIGIGCRHLIVT